MKFSVSEQDSSSFKSVSSILKHDSIGHFTAVDFVAKPLIWSEAEDDHVVIESRFYLAWKQSTFESSNVSIITRSSSASLLFKKNRLFEGLPSVHYNSLVSPPLGEESTVWVKCLPLRIQHNYLTEAFDPGSSAPTMLPLCLPLKYLLKSLYNQSTILKDVYSKFWFNSSAIQMQWTFTWNDSSWLWKKRVWAVYDLHSSGNSVIISAWNKIKNIAVLHQEQNGFKFHGYWPKVRKTY